MAPQLCGPAWDLFWAAAPASDAAAVESFMGFSEAQKQAIMHREGPMMVLAGPGSGKTTVITRRVRFLTEKCGVKEGDILVITFTRAAAAEMKERCEALRGPSRVSFGTPRRLFPYTEAGVVCEPALAASVCLPA